MKKEGREDMTEEINNKDTNKKKKRETILIIIGVTILLCILCLVIAIIYNATPQGQARNTERALTKTAEITLTPTFTETVKPTETPHTTNTPKLTNTPQPINTTESVEETDLIYVVNNDTTLWEKLGSEDPQQEGLRDLKEGVRLKPAEDAETLNCVDDIVYDIPITLCKVEVIETGEVGWVNEKWIELE